jgi:outer membrane protein
MQQFKGANNERSAEPMRMSPKTRCTAALLMLVALTGLGARVCRADEYKIGVINTDRILREAAPAKEAARKIEQEFKARDAELTKRDQELRDLVSRMDRDGATLSEPDRNARQREIETRTRDIERMRRQLADDLKSRQFDEMSKIKERLDVVLTKMAKDQGYDLILQDGLYVGRSVDITDAVIKALDAR